MSLFDQRGQTVNGTQINVGSKSDFDQRGQKVNGKPSAKPTKSKGKDK